MEPGKRRSVLITGASTGIGEACALMLAEKGFHVFAGVRKTQDGEALCKKAKGNLEYIILEITDARCISSAVERVAKTVGDDGLYGLVNNAGIVVGGPLEFIPIEALRKQFDVNVIGQIAVTQAFLPLLRIAHGRIVNMGSIGGRVATPFQSPYNASKSAMESFTDSLRIELHPWGIHVCIIEPGNIATPIWKKSLAAFDEMSTDISPRMYDLYGSFMDGMRKYINKPRTVPPTLVAEAVADALMSDNPKVHYLVGKDARSLVWLTYLPASIKDWLILQRLHKKVS
jgi:NAD(P)-dependent dehydrogenase (short-subunit alcohol dehydrogenase family)